MVRELAGGGGSMQIMRCTQPRAHGGQTRDGCGDGREEADRHTSICFWLWTLLFLFCLEHLFYGIALQTSWIMGA
jgi:hypothetical protein